MKIIDLNEKFKDKETTLEEALVLHVVGAIALHRKIQEIKEIEKAYELNKKEFFNRYRNSNYYKHHFMMSMPAEDSILMQKLIGMYLYEEEKGQGKELLKKYIISGFKKTFDHVQSNRVINIGSLLSSYSKQLEGLPESHSTMIGAIALFLGYPSKEVIKEPNFREVVYNILFNITNVGNDEEFNKERIPNELPALRKFQEIMGFKFGKEEMLDSLLARHDLFVSEKMLTVEEKRKLVGGGDYNTLYKKGLMRYWKPLTTILRLNQLNDMNFGDLTITRGELVDIYTIYIVNKDKGRIKEEEYELFFMSSLLTLMLTKYYLSLRDTYQEKFELDSGLISLIEEDKFAEERQKFLDNEKEMRQTLGEQNQLIERQQAEIERLTRQLKEKEESFNENDQLKKEVVALREYAFMKENELEYDTEEFESQINADIELLKDKKIAVIGGHPKWHTKLKEFLPGARMVSPDELGIDLSFINHMDIVCFETTYNNHSQYKRVLNQLKNDDDIKFLYINDKNIERTISLIARKIQ